MNAEEVKQQFQQASTLFQTQEYQQALEILDHLDDAVPNNQDIMYFKARVLGVLNRNQEASAFCDRLTALGDPRGEQLKAALNVAPSGPPPIPVAQDMPGSSVPPILPDQDTAQSSYEPPPFAAGRSSNKRMNIIGFGLMGTLLLAALIVVIVRSGGSKEDKTTPPPGEKQLASVQTEDEGASAETATPASAEETGEATVSEETAGEKEAATSEEAPASESEAKAEIPATEKTDTPELSAADLESMDPAEVMKTMQEMDTAELAKLLKTQAEAAVALMEQQIEQQGTPAEAKQFVTLMRQELENTDFVEEAKNFKEMMAQATPEMLAQMNALFSGGAPPGDLPLESSSIGTGDSLTDDIMKDFDFEGEAETEIVETDAEKAQEQSEGETTTEEPVKADETTTSEEPAKPQESTDTPKEEEPVEKTEQEPKEETKEELKEDSEDPKEETKEEIIKPVFGEEVAKVLEFPEDESLGSVYLRRKGALEREPWERVGEAIGKIGIPPNQDVKVQIEKYHLEPLLKLEPDDIQILSLWDVKVDDKGIEPIKHLKGLKELDIRQTEISPDGWVELQKALPECRILY